MASMTSGGELGLETVGTPLKSADVVPDTAASKVAGAIRPVKQMAWIVRFDP
ncbi:hypothetical protein [Sedimenticola selenatireducens]|uniref:hypothetical protein n=1 Tax=Sedimenticola selenatireducens TaxID=191960 RepID=UPI002AAB5DDD|nr:hypothetical protein [Sedimenticola selenatireducens]